ncbi:hypothetical protein B7486_74555 [cyanobacterium TDX16]|nr:hypothetical protein B7486_74555 [cyanobacterium TDX16]
MVWTGNVLRQPAFAGIEHRAPADGLPNADRVMDTGLILPNNHALDDVHVEHVADTAARFLAAR